MRRLSTRLIKDPLLRKLAGGLNSIQQAKNELRWIRQELSTADVPYAVTLRGQYNFPLQYILGSQPFGSLDIKCDLGVLIPRWETEEWVSQLADQIQKGSIRSLASTPSPRILDLCTGTGCVLFGLCDLLPNASGVAVDLSDQAIELCKRNQHELKMEQRTSVAKHDLFQSLPTQLRSVDIVVANPPYITDLSKADHDVRRYEPELALREPSPQIWDALVNRVMETEARFALFEVGYKSQIDQCIDLFAKHNWECEGKRDSNGKWRTVWASKA